MKVSGLPRLAGALGLGAAVAGCAAGPAPVPPSEPPPPRAVESAPCRLPVADILLPGDPRLLPTAPRTYRGGEHEGVDFFWKMGGISVGCGEPVLSSCSGTVVRADHDWQDLSKDEYARVTSELKQAPNEEHLDRVRGRQVWVRREDGTVLRYCHLQSVAPEIRIGLAVEPGTPLGAVGNTGTSDGSRGTEQNCHLHFEVRPEGGGYLGQGGDPGAARRLYADFFGME